MKTKTKHALGLGAALCASTCLAGPAFAAYDLFSPPPSHQTVDRNGVDLGSGLLSITERPVAVGPAGPGGLSYIRSYIGHGWRHNFVVTLTKNPQNLIYTVSFGGESHNFAQQADSTFYPMDQSPNRLILNADGTYTYYTAAGERVGFVHYNDTKSQYDSSEGLVTSITYPGGDTVRFTYRETDHPGSCGGCYVGHRLQSVNNNLGYQLKFEYPAVSDQVTTDAQFKDWTNITKVTAFNMAVDKCDVSVVTCTFTQTWPSATYATPTGTTSTTKDALNKTITYTYSGDQITKVQTPEGVVEDVTYDATSTLITHTTTPAGTWDYTFTAGNGLTGTVTDPANHVTATHANGLGQITSETDALSNVTSYVYESTFGQQTHLRAIIRPGGQYLGSGVYTDSTSYGYDTRGNVNLIKVFPKSGSSLAVKQISLTYPADTDSECTGTGQRQRCNHPKTVVDANGNQTDFTYNSAGWPATVTLPAPATGKPRPQTVSSYTNPPLTAYFWQKNTSGVYQILAGEGGVLRPISVSSCMTGAVTGTGCATTADGSKTTFDYGNTSGSVATNLLPVSITKGSGDGTLAATTGLTWTSDGDVSTVDGPLGTSSDTTAYFYDDMRQRTGVIGPRPDGNTGTAQFRAVKYLYNGDGQIAETDTGSTATQNQAGLNGITLRQRFVNDYTNGQLMRSYLLQGSVGTIRSSTEYNYDTVGRLQCATVRLTNVGTVLTNTCSGGTKDRVTKYIYDERNRVKTVTTAFGRTEAQSVDYTYEIDGQMKTIEDGRNNLTTYNYDGLHRVNIVKFPNTTAGSGTSSTTDWKTYVYDPNGNVTDVYTRRGDHIVNSIDNLNRVYQRTVSSAPVGVTKSDTFNYEYDNLNRMTRAYTTGSLNPEDLHFEYDALSRMTKETQPFGDVESTYNAAGQRVRLDWPDTYFTKYDYDWTGALTAVYEKNSQPGDGAGVLAQIAYDDLGLGRRVSLKRADGAGVKTSYKYNDANGQTPWLTELDLGFSDTDAVTYTFNNNLAGGIDSRVIDNNEFAWTDHFNVNRGYTPINGLNQPSKSGSLNLSYDAGGNLSSDGSQSYAYDSDDRLVTAGSSTLRYDPLGRLYKSSESGGTRFLYDGDNIIGEYDNSGTLLRRYVHGDRDDEALVWYEGAGVTDRRWMVADNKGSVVGLANDTGDLMVQGISLPYINTYDEYGVPGADNFGRFQYTGQAWLPAVGMYYYKARTYSPNLGRFLQTDPVGYPAGMNLYAYVADDPINFSDPAGTDLKWDWLTGKTETGGPGYAVGVGYSGPGEFGSSENSTVEVISGGNPGFENNGTVDTVYDTVYSRNIFTMGFGHGSGWGGAPEGRDAQIADLQNQIDDMNRQARCEKAWTQGLTAAGFVVGVGTAGSFLIGSEIVTAGAATPATVLGAGAVLAGGAWTGATAGNFIGSEIGAMACGGG